MEKSESLYTAVGNVNCLSNHGKQYGNFSKIKNRTTIVVVATIQCSVISNSLWLHGLQYARLLCPSPSPRAYSNPCPLNQWCHPTIPSSITSSHPLLSASASVLPMNIQDWFPLVDFFDLLQSKGCSRVFSNTTVQKHQFFSTQPSLRSNSHICNDYWKNHSFDY